jgi:hypothetical protein
MDQYPQQAAGEPAGDLDPNKQQAFEKLDALGHSLAQKRKDAIDGRMASGIEQEWIEDEDAYEGIDDANRGSERNASRYGYRKPSSTDGTLTREVKSQTRSTVFLNITQSYVDAGAAKAQEILIPTDDKPWGLNPTPIPELVETIEQVTQVEDQGKEQGQPLAGLPGGPQLDQAKQMAEQVIEKAKKCAEKAEERIDDWLVEGQWHGEVRDVIDDAARTGTGILKGPFPVLRKHCVWEDDPQTGTKSLVIKEEIKPQSKRVDCWNFFPDPLCGEDIHRGSFVFERDDITVKTLRELRTTPGYIAEQIEACIKEGPQKPDSDSPQHNESRTDKIPFEIWYYHGTIEKEEMEAAGCVCVGEDTQDYSKYQEAIPALITMVNGRVIKAALNPLDTGDFPYDVMVWKKRKGHWAGIGISRQVRAPQRMINAATRNMLDNAGLTAGPQIAIMMGVLKPMDGNSELSPRKMWAADPDKIDDIRKAITSINIECNQADLMAIIQFALKMAEDVTGLPMILQGQQGKAPDTVGGMTILNNNASAVLRRIARLFDHRIIEPHIERYYKWLMEYGEDEEEKGLFVIDARGSTVLMERDLQHQFIMSTVAQMALQPAFMTDPAKAAEEIYKSAKLDPKRFMYDEQQQKQIQENASKQPPDPSVQVAQMRAELEQWKTQQTQAFEAKLLQMQQAFDAEQNDKDRRIDLTKEVMAHENSGMDAGSQSIEAAKIKADLAKTAIVERNKANEQRLRRQTGAGI